MLVEGNGITETTTKVKNGSEMVKIRLMERQKWVGEMLAGIEQSDPVLVDSEPEPEIGTESWRSTTHAEKEVERQGLLRLQRHTRQAMKLVEEGKFGTCEICKGEVEAVRLNHPLTALKCASCASSASRVSLKHAS